jgi:1,2-diacylglycerol 3-alpha-glucosyltransferase
VSRLVKEKNIPFLLEVFEAIHKEHPQEFELTIVGYGAYARYLKRYAFEILKLPKDLVKFVEKKGKQELISVYHAGDLFLFASLSDTQGLVLAEAMSCGTPAIALDGPGQRDIIKQGVNGFLVGNAQEMAEVIKKVSKDPVLHGHLQQGAYETGQEYAPSLLAQRVVGWYKKILANEISN